MHTWVTRGSEENAEGCPSSRENEDRGQGAPGWHLSL